MKRLRVSPLEINEEYTVYGPYLHNQQNRWFVVYRYENRTTTKSYARWYVEQFWRKLEIWEEVDHVDDNPLNNDPINFQILTRKQNHNKPHAVILSKINGSKGGKTLANKRTSEERSAYAVIAGRGNKGKSKTPEWKSKLSEAAKIQWAEGRGPKNSGRKRKS